MASACPVVSIVAVCGLTESCLRLLGTRSIPSRLLLTMKNIRRKMDRSRLGRLLTSFAGFAAAMTQTFGTSWLGSMVRLLVGLITTLVFLVFLLALAIFGPGELSIARVEAVLSLVLRGVRDLLMLVS